MSTTAILNGQFDLASDRDYFRVTLTAGERYEFDLVGSGATPVRGAYLSLIGPYDNAFGFSADATNPHQAVNDGNAYGAFVAPVSGVYYLLAAAFPEGTGTYTVGVRTIASDAEPDLPGQGTLLTVGQLQSGSFDVLHDVDNFRVALVAGQRYSFSLEGAGTNPIASARLELLGSQHQSLAPESGATGIAVGGTQFVYTARASGVYDLRASLGKDASYDDKGSYQIGVNVVSADDRADLPAQATRLDIGTALPGRIELRGDLDYFRVDLVAGSRYLFSLTGADDFPGENLLLRLMGSDGETLRTDSAFATQREVAKFVFEPAESGPHFLLATLSYNNLPQGMTAAYQVSAALVASDDHADLPRQGTLLELGQTLQGRIDLRGDQDYFRVELVAGQRYLFSMLGAGADPIDYGKLSLLDAAHQRLMSDTGYNNIRATEPGAKFVFSPATSGTYYLLAERDAAFPPAFGTEVSSYAVKAIAVAADDHGDLPSLAAPLGIGSTVAIDFDLNNDRDFFSVNLVAQQRYLFKLRDVDPHPADQSTPLLQLFDANGARLTNDFNAREISYQAPVTGSYTLMTQWSRDWAAILGVTPSRSYTLSATSLAADDHSDVRDLGTMLLPGSDATDQAPRSANGFASTSAGRMLVRALPPATDPDGDRLSYAKASEPAHGSVTVSAGGVFTFVPDPGFSGDDAFNFTVLDGRSGSNTYGMHLSVAKVYGVSSGTAGADNITGSAGADQLVGLGGDDQLAGLAGLDLLVGGAGNDTLDGGSGIDIADYRGAGAIDVNLQTGTATQGSDTDTLIGVEAIFGSDGNDIIRGVNGIEADRGETIRGGPGNDTLDGGTGNDTAEYTGVRAEYAIHRPDPSSLPLTVTHSGGGADGVDTLANIERLVFADQLLAFGHRAEEVWSVAVVLWSPAIVPLKVDFQPLFARGLSFYDVGYSFEYLCEVALMFFPEPDAALAHRLWTNTPGTARSENDVLAIIGNAGGGLAGRAAAVAAMAKDPAMAAQMELSGIRTDGVVADLFVPGFGDLFNLLPG